MVSRLSPFLPSQTLLPFALPTGPFTMSDYDGEEVSRNFSTYTNPAETKSTVIIGAGIIGCATAYYLSRSGNTKPDTIHLIEASPELFASASGKAAGFLASDCESWIAFRRWHVLTGIGRVWPFYSIARRIIVQATQRPRRAE